MCAGFRDAGDAVACTAAEVSVVALRMDDPVVPADGGEVDVKRVPAAFAGVRSAIDVPRLAAYRPLRKRVNHDEGLAVAMHGDGQAAGAARLACHLDGVRQVVELHPVLHWPCDVDLLPNVAALRDLADRQRLRFGEVQVGPPMTDL